MYYILFQIKLQINFIYGIIKFIEKIFITKFKISHFIFYKQLRIIQKIFRWKNFINYL